MTLFKRSWPNAVRSSGAVCISCDADRTRCKVCVDKTQFDESDESEPLPAACVATTSMVISTGCFCRALSCEMLGLFVGVVGVSATYWNSLMWTAGETHRGGRTCALPCCSSGRSSALGIVRAFLFWWWVLIEVFFHLRPYLLPVSICWLLFLNYGSSDHLLSCLHSPSRCANQARGRGLWESL